MKPIPAFALGAGLVGTSLIIAAGDAFLWAWNRGADGQTDIIARGPFLLGIYLPSFLLAAAIVTAIVAALMGRRSSIDLRWRLVLAVLAVCLGFALVYIEPTGVFFQARQALPNSDSILLKLSVDANVLLGGMLLIWKASSPATAAT